MNLICALMLFVQALLIHGQSEMLLSKLRQFADENPRYDVNSQDCELMIYDKSNSRKRQDPTNLITTRISGKFDLKRGIPYFFDYAGSRFTLRGDLLFTFNLIKDIK